MKVVQPQDHRGCCAPIGQVGARAGPPAGATGAKLEAPANCMAEAGPALETVREEAGPMAGPAAPVPEGLLLACGES